MRISSALLLASSATSAFAQSTVSSFLSGSQLCYVIRVDETTTSSPTTTSSQTTTSTTLAASTTSVVTSDATSTSTYSATAQETQTTIATSQETPTTTATFIPDPTTTTTMTSGATTTSLMSYVTTSPIETSESTSTTDATSTTTSANPTCVSLAVPTCTQSAIVDPSFELNSPAWDPYKMTYSTSSIVETTSEHPSRTGNQLLEFDVYASAGTISYAGIRQQLDDLCVGSSYTFTGYYHAPAGYSNGLSCTIYVAMDGYTKYYSPLEASNGYTQFTFTNSPTSSSSLMDMGVQCPNNLSYDVPGIIVDFDDFTYNLNGLPPCPANG